MTFVGTAHLLTEGKMFVVAFMTGTSHDKNNLRSFTLHAHVGARATCQQQANMAMKKKRCLIKVGQGTNKL